MVLTEEWMKLKLQTKKPKHNKDVHSIGLAKKFGFIHPFSPTRYHYTGLWIIEVSSFMLVLSR